MLHAVVILHIFAISYHFLKAHSFSTAISLFVFLCGLVVRILDYSSGGPGSIPGTTRKKSSGSGTGSTQPREYN
jgi:hypothetical protein